MKTTIDLDEAKLLSLMKLTGIKTRKEAVNYALTEGERLARVNDVLKKPYYVSDDPDVFDMDYDILKMRELEKPNYRPDGEQ